MYSELLSEIWELEDWLSNTMEELYKCEDYLKESYKPKYVDLLFEFYNSANNFSQITEDSCNIENEEDIKDLMIDFEKFIDSYSRLIQFFEFGKVKEPDDLWIAFNYWKNKRLDIIENN